jgi:hypothetical protein
MPPWAQIVVTLITTAGSVVSGWFALQARSRARDAHESAQRAEASMRPPRDTQ